MATGGGRLCEEDMSKTSCILCMERYGKERRPKILPCLHSFCLQCLKQLEASTKDSQQTAGQSPDSESKEEEVTAKVDSEGECGDFTNTGNDVTTSRPKDDVKKAEFLCPMCQALVSIPEGGVAFLQTNFYVDDIVTSNKAIPPQMCNMCRQDGQQQADHVCLQCNLRMCPDCRRHHDMCTRGHHVTPLIPGQSGQTGNTNKALCSLHPDQPLPLYCRQCDVTICLKCQATSHEGHRTVDIASVEAECMSEIPALLTQAEQQLQVVETSLRHTERDERNLSRHAQNLTHEIRGRCDVIVASVTQSRDELLEEVREMEDRARSELRAQKNSASLTVDTLSTLVTRAARAESDHAISLKKKLQAALLSEDMLEQHRQQMVRHELWSGWTYDAADVSAVPVTAYMGKVMEVSACDVTKPPSLAELTDKLDRLENDMKTITTNLKEQVDKTETSIAETNADLKKTNADVNTMDTNMKKQEDKIETSIAETKADLTKTKADVNTMNTNMKKQADKIAKAGTMVAFLAVDIDKAKTKRDEPIIFTDVKVNEGGCYDQTTGKFTAPVRGTYVFSAGVGKAGNSSYVSAKIMVNDERHVSLYGTSTSTGSNSECVQLEVGHTVYLKARSDGNDYTTSSDMCFTGALVQPEL